MRRATAGFALALLTAGPGAHAQEAPLLYRQIAARYQLSAAALYQLALQRAGRQSRFAPTPTPWPWTVRLCAQAICETVYPADRAAMVATVATGQAAGLRIYVGPLGLALHSVPGLPVQVITSPRVTLNEAARQLAMALTARRLNVPDAHPASSVGETRPVLATSRRSSVPTARAQRWAPLVDRIATEEGLDPRLVHAIVAAESAYNAAAVSPKNAVGLMQLIPATAERFGLPRDQRHDPEANLRAGSRYLKWLLAYFDNDLSLAVAGYNAGEGAVNRYGRRIPPYPETQTYVRRVRHFMTQSIGG